MVSFTEAVVAMRDTAVQLKEAEAFARLHPGDDDAAKPARNLTFLYRELTTKTVPDAMLASPLPARRQFAVVRSADGDRVEWLEVALDDEIRVIVSHGAERDRALSTLEACGHAVVAAELRQDRCATTWRQSLSEIARLALEEGRDLPWKELGIRRRRFARFLTTRVV